MIPTTETYLWAIRDTRTTPFSEPNFIPDCVSLLEDYEDGMVLVRLDERPGHSKRKSVLLKRSALFETEAECHKYLLAEKIKQEAFKIPDLSKVLPLLFNPPPIIKNSS